jgi:hypothetical protein
VVASEAIAREHSSSIKACIIAANAAGPPMNYSSPHRGHPKSPSQPLINDIELNLTKPSPPKLSPARGRSNRSAKLNVHGAIAQAPIGASGRVLVTLLHALADRNNDLA